MPDRHGLLRTARYLMEIDGVATETLELANAGVEALDDPIDHA